MIDMEKVRDALQTIADSGTDVDSGSGLGSVDFWFTMNGREYYIEVKPSNAQRAKDQRGT